MILGVDISGRCQTALADDRRDRLSLREYGVGLTSPRRVSDQRLHGLGVTAVAYDAVIAHRIYETLAGDESRLWVVVEGRDHGAFDRTSPSALLFNGRRVDCPVLHVEIFTRAAIEVILRASSLSARLRWAARANEEPTATKGGDPSGTYKRWFGRVSGRDGW
jgi:hypothetical protein